MCWFGVVNREQRMSVLADIENKVRSGKKMFFLLIDPDKVPDDSIKHLFEKAGTNLPDLVLIGGSLISKPVEPVIEKIKKVSLLPIFLFPGSLLQISGKADGILLLNLISGRNPEYLIGNHVVAAPLIKYYRLEAIPTGYILIAGTRNTSVEIVSNTHPLPVQRPDIITATALAGEYMGNRLIYLEKGSGADMPVPADIVARVKEESSVPLIVGGGIRSATQAEELYQAGADILVVGNAIEKRPGFIKDMRDLADNL